ncbi:long-chain fatty acid--CoA ligase [Exilibacterium tricleocarpae]|uniref:Long-chain fatty acid--CoA ligase n=1 Tax=Exilibacterium tricleocarpae TaxID=2591008 RepID=A0A545TYZ2_9GAMM|nr:AMP-binding protein [Exilibacterium tricleocarpae]TQV82436.1 long-chain fatty acid--CoA ligase [Exilibacterium tricleocarpae]
MKDLSAELNKNLIERVAMGDILRRRARDAGPREALVEFVDGERRAVTYLELNRRVNRLVRGLRARGLEPGDKVALLEGNTIDFATVAFACYKAGWVFVPINFLQNPDDIRYNFEHAQVSAVIYSSLLENIAVDCGKDLAHIRFTVSIGTEAGAADARLADLMDESAETEILDTVIKDRDTAQIIYTSGTTSRAKGVMSSHLALFLATLNNPLSVGFARYHRHLSVLPLFHIAAQVNYLCTLQLGGTVVLLNQFDPVQFADTMAREKIAGTALLPMMWQALLNVPDIKQRDFSALETGIYAMAPIARATLEALRSTFDCKFHLGSGQTEFTPVPCVFLDGTETQFGEGNYWGSATMVADQAVLDDHGNELPPGEVGEICWRGPQAMNGYLNNPEATTEVHRGGWHRSGDLGLIDDKGQLLFVDRKKDMIKSGGENIASNKVEKVILGIEGVLVTAVFGVPHPHWDEAVCAAVQAAPGVNLTEAEVIDHCKRHLGGYEVPKRVLFPDSLPFTASGKVQKQPLRRKYRDLFTGTGATRDQ